MILTNWIRNAQPNKALILKKHAGSTQYWQSSTQEFRDWPTYHRTPREAHSSFEKPANYIE